MRKRMMFMMERLRRFMYGRYGNDQLNNALIVGCLVLMLVGMFFHTSAIYVIGLVLLVLCYARMLSRNTAKRFSENQKFLIFWNKVKKKASDVKFRFADRKTHRYFKCPTCKQRLRVPKGRGKLNISCPHCRTSFVKKT